MRIFNYKLSRARCTIENAFGILSAKWMVFRRPIMANIELVERITKAIICLHNDLRLTENAKYIPTGLVDSEDETGQIIPEDWRAVIQDDEGGLTNARRIEGNHYTFDAGKSREDSKDYLSSEKGQVAWQWQYVRNCAPLGKF